MPRTQFLLRRTRGVANSCTEKPGRPQEFAFRPNFERLMVLKRGLAPNVVSSSPGHASPVYSCDDSAGAPLQS